MPCAGDTAIVGDTAHLPAALELAAQRLPLSASAGASAAAGGVQYTQPALPAASTQEPAGHAVPARGLQAQQDDHSSHSGKPAVLCLVCCTCPKVVG